MSQGLSLRAHDKAKCSDVAMQHSGNFNGGGAEHLPQSLTQVVGPGLCRSGSTYAWPHTARLQARKPPVLLSRLRSHAPRSLSNRISIGGQSTGRCHAIASHRRTRASSRVALTQGGCLLRFRFDRDAISPTCDRTLLSRNLPRWLTKNMPFGSKSAQAKMPLVVSSVFGRAFWISFWFGFWAWRCVSPAQSMGRSGGIPDGTLF